METKLKDLLINEEQSRFNNNYSECLQICLQILIILQNSKAKEPTIYDIISKILFKKNQSNFVRIGIIFHIIHNNYMNILDDKTLKNKYYQLLIDSFKYDEVKDKSEEKDKIISLYESANQKNFKNLDSFILSLDMIYISEKSNSSDKEIYEKTEANKNLVVKFKDHRKESEYGIMHEESQQNEITQIGLVENINKNVLDLNSDIQTIFRGDLSDGKGVDKIMNKKYKVNNKLPMIVLSISVNMNTNDFMKLIKDNFIKLNYKNIMNVKSTLYDNVDIYEYNTHNVFQQMVYCLFNDKAFIRSVYQVTTILQKDENNFTHGLNYFLNDNKERKLAIKSIKGTEKNN